MVKYVNLRASNSILPVAFVGCDGFAVSAVGVGVVEGDGDGAAWVVPVAVAPVLGFPTASLAITLYV